MTEENTRIAFRLANDQPRGFTAYVLTRGESNVGRVTLVGSHEAALPAVEAIVIALDVLADSDRETVAQALRDAAGLGTAFAIKVPVAPGAQAGDSLT